MVLWFFGDLIAATVASFLVWALFRGYTMFPQVNLPEKPRVIAGCIMAVLALGLIARAFFAALPLLLFGVVAVLIIGGISLGCFALFLWGTKLVHRFTKTNNLP